MRLLLTRPFSIQNARNKRANQLKRIALQCRPQLIVLEDRTVPASFQGLGIMANYDWSEAYDISGNGSVVVGASYTPTASQAFRWTSSGGMVGLGFLPIGTNSSYAGGVSGDGSTIFGMSASGGFRWTSSTGMVGIDSYPSAYTAAFVGGVSNDGSVVVGQANPGPGAFRWNSTDGMVGLGDLNGGSDYSAAFDVSADGSTITGWSDSSSGPEAFKWTPASGMVGLGFVSHAYAISDDGQVIAGVDFSGSFWQAFRWTEGGGLVRLGDLDGGIDSSAAEGVSADGSVIVGRGTSAAGQEAFIWTAAGGIKSLRTLLVNDFGLSSQLNGWFLSNAVATSADGRVVIGRGTNPSGQEEAWIANLVPPKVVSVQINDGSPYRSRVTSLTVTLDSPVTISDPATAFQLKRQSDNFSVATNVSINGNTYTLTFPNGPGVEYGSLADGRYTLTLKAAQINNGNFDGNGDGFGGDDFVFASAEAPNPPTNIFRLFGDWNGDGSVSAVDFSAFRLYYGFPGGPTSFFDYNQDGIVSASDFNQFRLRFGVSI